MELEEQYIENFKEGVDKILKNYLAPMFEALSKEGVGDTFDNQVTTMAALAIAIGQVGIAFNHEPSFVTSAAMRSIIKVYRDSDEFKDHPFIKSVYEFEAMLDAEDEDEDEDEDGGEDDEVIH
jgi:hypothetical protein